jgi:hypothetical protein
MRGGETATDGGARRSSQELARSQDTGLCLRRGLHLHEAEKLADAARVPGGGLGRPWWRVTEGAALGRRFAGDSPTIHDLGLQSFVWRAARLYTKRGERRTHSWA